jgi:murein DD-endopeptidase MepM/ murein hydrolase activator NlpD
LRFVKKVERKPLQLLKKLLLFLLIPVLFSCGGGEREKTAVVSAPMPKIEYEYGFKLNDFKVVNDTIQKGEVFSEIMDRNHVEYPRVLEIVKAVKDTFNVRRIQAGYPYTILARKDSTEKAEVFIYKHSKVRYTVIDFRDSIIAYNGRKPVQRKELTASGIITSNLSEAMDEQGLNMYLAYAMADIYAWTIDFFRLQKNDRFKIIYEQLYINDTVPVGIGDIKAVYFEHGGKPFYGFRFLADKKLDIPDYFDEEANNLRRQFLKAPVKFGRMSSRYNLRRRIAYYGNRVRPHRGTDFAAPVGTEILATANGTVVESQYKGGNGNYVKIRHNSTYSTQYLHMSRRKVRVGEVVKQGDVIGYVGMTGNTAGPHVCYRFWKNGVQVDPLRQKLPAAEPMDPDVKPLYFEFIVPIKEKLDGINYSGDPVSERIAEAHN